MSIGCTNYYCLNPIYIVQISFRPLIFFSTVTLFSFTVALCRSRFLLKKFYCYCNDHPHAPFPFFSPHFFLSTVSLPPHSFSPFSFSSLLDSRLFISSSFFLTFPLPSPPHKTSFLPKFLPTHPFLAHNHNHLTLACTHTLHFPLPSKHQNKIN